MKMLLTINYEKFICEARDAIALVDLIDRMQHVNIEGYGDTEVITPDDGTLGVSVSPIDASKIDTGDSDEVVRDALASMRKKYDESNSEKYKIGRERDELKQQVETLTELQKCKLRDDDEPEDAEADDDDDSTM